MRTHIAPQALPELLLDVLAATPEGSAGSQWNIQQRTIYP